MLSKRYESTEVEFIELCLKCIAIVIVCVYYIIPFGFTLFWHLVSSLSTF